MPLSEYRAQGRGGKGTAGDGRARRGLRQLALRRERRTTSVLVLQRQGARPTGRRSTRSRRARARARGRAIVNFVGIEAGERRRRRSCRSRSSRRPLRDRRDEERHREANGAHSVREHPRRRASSASSSRTATSSSRRTITDGTRKVFIGTRNGMGISFDGDRRPRDGPRHDGRQGHRAARGRRPHGDGHHRGRRRRSSRSRRTDTASGPTSRSTAGRAAAARASST